jgi:hypothetical protein
MDQIPYSGGLRHCLRQDDTRERREETQRPPADPGRDTMNDAIEAKEGAAMSKKASRATSPQRATDTQGRDCSGHPARPLQPCVDDRVHPGGVAEALIRPIYKAASKEPLMVENWRAVSLVNVLAEGYESILCFRTTNHLESSLCNRRSTAVPVGPPRPSSITHPEVALATVTCCVCREARGLTPYSLPMLGP